MNRSTYEAALSRARADVARQPLTPADRGEWLAWALSEASWLRSQRDPREVDQHAAELRHRCAALGCASGLAIVGDAQDPRSVAAQATRTAEAWLEEWDLWMSASQEADFHRRVVHQLHVASLVVDPSRAREVTHAALRAWSEIAHAVMTNVRDPLTLAQRQTMEQATRVFNGAVPVLQAAQAALTSGVPWGMLGLGALVVGGVVVAVRATQRAT